jgi:hypothetical protein
MAPLPQGGLPTVDATLTAEEVFVDPIIHVSGRAVLGAGHCTRLPRLSPTATSSVKSCGASPGRARHVLARDRRAARPRVWIGLPAEQEHRGAARGHGCR